jgi:hypothetical protein
VEASSFYRGNKEVRGGGGRPVMEEKMAVVKAGRYWASGKWGGRVKEETKLNFSSTGWAS